MASAGPLPLIADGALVQALHDGDEAAFEEIFQRYYPTVYGILLRLTGSPEEAEDLAQDVFLRLYERPLGDNSNIGGWLYRTATNAGFNATRSRRRARDRILRWIRLEWAARSMQPSAEVEAERGDEAAMIRSALAQLSERDRTVLILRHSGVSYAEIAETVGVKTGSVGTILVRAERALRKRYVLLFGEPDIEGAESES